MAFLRLASFDDGSSEVFVEFEDEPPLRLLRVVHRGARSDKRLFFSLDREVQGIPVRLRSGDTPADSDKDLMTDLALTGLVMRVELDGARPVPGWPLDAELRLEWR